jgi:AraC-like DNA-binding protein
MLHSFDAQLEKLDGFETDFVKILYYDLPKCYFGNYKSYGYSRICTILEGEKQITIKNKTYTYDHNQTLLLPPHSTVHMNIEKPTKALVFELNDQLIQSVVSNANIKNKETLMESPFNELLIGNHDQNIMADVHQLIDISRSKDLCDPFILDLYAQKLVYGFLNIQKTSGLIMNQMLSPMQRAISHMKKHIHEPISIHFIAEQINMSESSFSHAFKKQMNVTPQKYMQNLKLECAIKLLAENSVTDVAFELGYENPSYFIRLFKEAYGVTPKQFQLHGAPIF